MPAKYLVKSHILIEILRITVAVSVGVRRSVTITISLRMILNIIRI